MSSKRSRKAQCKAQCLKRLFGKESPVAQFQTQLPVSRRQTAGSLSTTSVVATTCHPRARRTEPMRGGISIANGRIRGYGTLGGTVIDRETGAQMILSNWHVLVGLWQARPGWPIYQPGQGDGGTDADTVARLSRDAMAANLDAAVAELTGVRSLINAQFDLGPIKGVGWAEPGMAVIKSGRASGVTYGHVAGVEGTARMTYSGVSRLIRNVMTINPRDALSQVSTGGDSGSFWLEEETMNVVGLHFAGSDRPERALAIDMQPILDALKVDMAV